MRNKQARNLRKIIGDNLSAMPEVAYEEVNQRDKLFPVGLNTDGTTKYTTIRVSTRVLHQCQRQAYQKAKKLHKAYYTH